MTVCRIESPATCLYAVGCTSKTLCGVDRGGRDLRLELLIEMHYGSGTPAGSRAAAIVHHLTGALWQGVERPPHWETRDLPYWDAGGPRQGWLGGCVWRALGLINICLRFFFSSECMPEWVLWKQAFGSIFVNALLGNLPPFYIWSFFILECSCKRLLLVLHFNARQSQWFLPL